MIPARSVDRPSDVNDVMKVYRKFLNTKVLHDFQNVWGGIEGNRNLVHFLLKYKYLGAELGSRGQRELFAALSRGSPGDDPGRATKFFITNTTPYRT
jgi:hypothetical protein